MSLLKAIAGPTALIVVGSSANSECFHIHKQLLCDCSTYFKAALNNGFIETQNQTIELDDEDPIIFRTFVLWLYEKKLDKEAIPSSDETEVFQRHMLELYVFADKRGIVDLANDTITMLACLWSCEDVVLDDIEWLFPLILSKSQLYRLLLDNLILEARASSMTRGRLLGAGLPKAILVDLFLRSNHLPESFNLHTACFNSVCYYHLHDQQDGMSKEECIRRVEAGYNVWSPNINLKQQEWNLGWD
ncbi:hypothetical protein E4T50_07052 [Aureobasidium sp. EXF-12298]